MHNTLDNYKYINHQSSEIINFTKKMSENTSHIKEVINNIFKWFDENMEYTRLNSPYYPLQRSDIDTLLMRSGTCGDYSNLVVSILLNLGIPAKYAYLKRDCYGDYQDHICVIAKIDDNWILIDPTLPYRKWEGYETPHKEYDIYTPEEFEEEFKKKENYWTELALKWGEEKYAGLLYAPWVHEETVINTDTNIETVFYLLVFNNIDDWNLYIYYLEYTPERSSSPIMSIINPENCTYRFSITEVESIWNEEQWSPEYTLEIIPENLKGEKFFRFNSNIERNLNKIMQIIPK